MEKRTTWYNRRGQNFRISKDSLEKIEKEGTKAGKYLTFDQVNNGWVLTDTRNEWNAGRTYRYSCNYDDEFDYNPGEPVSVFDCIAWSLGYTFTQEEFNAFMDDELAEYIVKMKANKTRK